MIYVIVLITYIICREELFEWLFPHLVVVIDEGDKYRGAHHVRNISSLVWEGSNISFVFITFHRMICLMFLDFFDSQRSTVTRVVLDFIAVKALDFVVEDRWVFAILASHVGIFTIVRHIEGMFTFVVIAVFVFVLIVAAL